MTPGVKAQMLFDLQIHPTLNREPGIENLVRELRWRTWNREPGIEVAPAFPSGAISG
jgi:hypothetical protein